MMKPRYLQADTGNRDRWMISYMDMLTILLIFFVSVAAQSMHLLPSKATAAKATTRSQSPAPALTPAALPTVALPVIAATLEPEHHEALLAAQKSLAQHGLDLRLEPRGLVISLPQAILFPSGEDRVGPKALPLLSQIADVLRGLPNKVSLEGHTDSVPIHNRHFKNNWDLSIARSVKIMELLTQRYGIPDSRLYLASYGAYRPTVPNATEEGRSRNRRVEIVILDESGDSNIASLTTTPESLSQTNPIAR